MVRELCVGLSQLWQYEGSGRAADLLGLYGTLLFAERCETEFGASIKQVRCFFGCVRVAKLLCALAAQPLLSSGRRAFVGAEA